MLKKGGRVLYVPSVTGAEAIARTTYDYDHYSHVPTITRNYIPLDPSKSLGYKKNNAMHFFLTDTNGTAEVAKITVEGEWKYDTTNYLFMVGYLKITAHGNFAGIDYKFILKDTGNVPFFSDINISAGETAMFNINVYLRNALVAYDSKFEIECECSDTPKKTTRYYSIYTETSYFIDEYEFSLKET